MKKWKMVVVLIAALMLLLPSPLLAKMGSGKVTAKSKDIDIEIFGSLKTYPTFVGNADFNEEDTAMDVLLDEGGYLDNDEVTVRNEFRLGFKGAGENWSFMVILESDIALDKNNCDRGARAG